ncbi:MAG: PAS domain-containing protein [Deltaproteobacteria bacterium]|nr:PAS domain-containing protein [Deltaproteobacteria bacterium]
MKERTARLTESNQRLHQEITRREKVEAELMQERDNLIRIFEAMEDRIYIVNSNYDILYMNPAFEKDFSPIEEGRCYEILNGIDGVCPWCNIEDVLSGSTARHEWFCARNGKTYDMVETPVKHANGSVNMLTLFRDITERRKARDVLKARNKELQTALKKVRQLSGLLPICASCKQIRDDAGYWHDVASYIRDHSEAEFSHSICPECLKKLYPEFIQE